MKKTETSIQAAKDDRDTRIEVLESRLAKLDPQPPIEVMEPYPVGSQVYSVGDAEGTVPFTVRGYEHPRGRILVMFPGDPEPRSMPVVSVVSLEQCSAIKSDRVVHQIGDGPTRAYWEGRRAALAAANAPPPPPPAKTPRYRWAD